MAQENDEVDDFNRKIVHDDDKVDDIDRNMVQDMVGSFHVFGIGIVYLFHFSICHSTFSILTI